MSSQEQLVAILKKRDPKWVEGVAARLDRPPSAIGFHDLRDEKFASGTPNKIKKDVEWLFGVCLPLSVGEKSWVVGDYLEYIEKRAENLSVNIKLTQKYAPPVTAVSIVIVSLLSLPFWFAMSYVLSDTHNVSVWTLAISAICLFPAANLMINTITFGRLRRRIQQCADKREAEAS